MACTSILTRTWRGASESDRPALSLCRPGDLYFAPGIADEVIVDRSWDLAWQSLVSNGALTSKRVVKTTAPVVFTVASTDATATTTVDILVNGRPEASLSLPFTPPT